MELDDDLRTIFLGEVAGYLQVLEDPDATLEARGDAAHGLKGAAGMLGFHEIHSQAGVLEQAYRRGQSPPEPNPLTRIRECVDDLNRGKEASSTSASGKDTAHGDGERDPMSPPCAAQVEASLDQSFEDELGTETAAMLRAFFVEEAHEHLASMERVLGLLGERPTDATLVDALFRSSHTIKGAAATVGLGRIGEAAHRLEDRFEEIRDHGEPATPSRLAALVRATDLLRAMVDSGDPQEHASLLAEIRALVEASDSSTPSGTAGPASPRSLLTSPVLADPLEADCRIGFEDRSDFEETLPQDFSTSAALSGEAWDAEMQAILRETFTEEARELLRELDPLVETLSAAGQEAADLGRLFRLAHTLKGSSAAVGLPGIPEAAHLLEDHLEILQSGRPRSTPGPDLLAALSLLHDLVDAALEDAPTGDLLARFRAAMLGQRVSLSATSPEIAVPTPGRDAPSRMLARPATVERAEPMGLRGTVERRGSEDRRDGGRRQEEDRLIRVNAEHFDALLNHVGEIAFRRTLIERRSEELTGLVKDLGRTHQSFRAAIGELRSLRGTEAHVQRFSELEVELADELSNFERAESGLRDETEGLRRDAAHLQEGLTRIRLLSVRYLFARLRRAVRDIAHTEGKQVVLYTEGEDTEIDRVVAEKVADPMIQIIRNAVAHGIESPEMRRERGKSEAGSVTIKALQEGNFVTLEVWDDGGGIDLGSVRDALVSRGLMSPEEALEAPTEEVSAAIFLPGLSTRRATDAVAGRGVGLDVVRSALIKLGGEVSVSSQWQKGTRFVVRLPLSTAVVNALLFKTGGEVYCIGVRHVVETRYAKPDEIRSHRGRSSVTVREKHIPLLVLAGFLGVEPRHQGKLVPMVVLRHLELEFAVAVDRIVGPREIVLRKLGPLLDPLEIYAAATISGAAKVQLVLDVGTLHRFASAWRTLPLSQGPVRLRQQPRILVCDDSRSIQQVVSRILTEEGFTVELASDGWDAWERMNALWVDLLLTDLEMPRMDGYALVEKCRRDERLRDLPILVLSSRTGEENQRRAKGAGADGFLFKPVNRRVIVSRVQELLAASGRGASRGRPGGSGIG